ncbi:MAG: DUF2231 domain-containing protein [Alphaproteobacteria bacterium]
MFELFASMTALPNIHPVVVHFPIALAFAALAVEVASLIGRRQAWLERSAALLSALAAAGAGAAYLAGRQAADTIGVIPAAAEAVLADHADLALWTLVGLAIAAVIRVVSSVRDRQLAVSRLGALRATGLVALLIAVGLITRTADLGGALVYRYAVAAQTAPSETITTPAVVENEPAVVDVGSRLVRGANGALEWRPLPIDLAALGEVIAPAKGSDPAAVSAVERPGEGGGLALLLTALWGLRTTSVRPMRRCFSPCRQMERRACHGTAVERSRSSTVRLQLCRVVLWRFSPRWQVTTSRGFWMVGWSSTATGIPVIRGASAW